MYPTCLDQPITASVESKQQRCFQRHAYSCPDECESRCSDHDYVKLNTTFFSSMVLINILLCSQQRTSPSWLLQLCVLQLASVIIQCSSSIHGQRLHHNPYYHADLHAALVFLCGSQSHPSLIHNKFLDNSNCPDCTKEMDTRNHAWLSWW